MHGFPCACFYEAHRCWRAWGGEHVNTDFSLESCNKCEKCRKIFAEETSIKMTLKKTKYAGQEINGY